MQWLERVEEILMTLFSTLKYLPNLIMCGIKILSVCQKKYFKIFFISIFDHYDWNNNEMRPYY